MGGHRRSCTPKRVKCYDCHAYACVTHSKYVSGKSVCDLCVADSASAIAARKCANIASQKRVRDNIAARNANIMEQARAKKKAEKVASRAKHQPKRIKSQQYYRQKLEEIQANLLLQAHANKQNN